MRQTINEAFQSMISKRYDYDFDNTSYSKSLFEQLDECDVKDRARKLDMSIEEDLDDLNKDDDSSIDLEDSGDKSNKTKDENGKEDSLNGDSLAEGKVKDAANKAITSVSSGKLGKTYEVSNSRGAHQFRTQGDAEEYAEKNGGKVDEISNKEVNDIRRKKFRLHSKYDNKGSSLSDIQNTSAMLDAADKVKAKRKTVADYGEDKGNIEVGFPKNYTGNESLNESSADCYWSISKNEETQLKLKYLYDPEGNILGYIAIPNSDSDKWKAFRRVDEYESLDATGYDSEDEAIEALEDEFNISLSDIEIISTNESLNESSLSYEDLEVYEDDVLNIIEEVINSDKYKALPKNIWHEFEGGAMLDQFIELYAKTGKIDSSEYDHIDKWALEKGGRALVHLVTEFYDEVSEKVQNYLDSNCKNITEASNYDREYFFHIKGDDQGKISKAKSALEKEGIEYEILTKDQVCNNQISGIYTTNESLNEESTSRPAGMNDADWSNLEKQGPGAVAAKNAEIAASTPTTATTSTPTTTTTKTSTTTKVNIPSLKTTDVSKLTGTSTGTAKLTAITSQQLGDTTHTAKVGTLSNGTQSAVGTVSGNLKLGSTGDSVSSLQKQLGLEASGTFDKRTEAALKKWQENNGLKADGVYGTLSNAAMTNLIYQNSNNQTRDVNTIKAEIAKLAAVNKANTTKAAASNTNTEVKSNTDTASKTQSFDRNAAFIPDSGNNILKTNTQSTAGNLAVDKSGNKLSRYTYDKYAPKTSTTDSQTTGSTSTSGQTSATGTTKSGGGRKAEKERGMAAGQAAAKNITPGTDEWGEYLANKEQEDAAARKAVSDKTKNMSTDELVSYYLSQGRDLRG